MTRFAMVSLGGAAILAGVLVAGPAARPAASFDQPEPAAAPGDGAVPRELTAEFLEKCLEVAEEVDPKLATRLRDMQRRSPGPAFERAVRNARHLAGLVRLKESDPTLYGIKLGELKVDAQVNALAAQVCDARRSGTGVPVELEAELRTLVEQQVGLSITARGMYLLRLRENMKALQDQLGEDASNFGRTVDRRMADLCGE